jgi:hypothetical protein
MHLASECSQRAIVEPLVCHHERERRRLRRRADRPPLREAPLDALDESRPAAGRIVEVSADDRTVAVNDGAESVDDAEYRDLRLADLPVGGALTARLPQLITGRSQVQILPPLLERPRKRGLSRFRGSGGQHNFCPIFARMVAAG